MTATIRLGWFMFLAAAAALVVDVQPSAAQGRRGRISFGGSNNNQSQNQQNNNNSNNNNNDDDDDKNQSNQSNNSRGGGSGNSQNNQNMQQIQQLLQGGGNNNQNTQSSRRGGRGQQGQIFQQGQLNSQQNQNFQPWQMWQGQNNRGNNNRGNNRGPQNQNNNSNWFVQFGGGPTPFSVGWYESNPHAWHWHGNNNNNNNQVWKVATAASVIGWLGWGTPHTTYYAYEPQPWNVPIFDPEAVGPWMTLGVYSLLTGPADTGTRVLQLSINQQGYLRGSYYDMITNDTYNVRGRIDQQTQYAQWSIDTNRQLTFYTPLSQLTEPQGFVNIRLPGGTQQWQVVRMEYAN